jgi:hypothetical protein
MKFALMAAALITLPAIAAAVYGFASGNYGIMYAALFSFSLNALPFVVAGLFMTKHKGADLGH